MTDAELIDWAERMAEVIEDDELRSSCDLEPAAGLLRDLADRLAELTKPAPWRSVDEPPADTNDVFIRDRRCDGTEVVKIGYYDVINRTWPRTSTVIGWQPIVRPAP